MMLALVTPSAAFRSPIPHHAAAVRRVSSIMQEDDPAPAPPSMPAAKKSMEMDYESSGFIKLSEAARTKLDQARRIACIHLPVATPARARTWLPARRLAHGRCTTASLAAPPPAWELSPRRAQPHSR